MIQTLTSVSTRHCIADGWCIWAQITGCVSCFHSASILSTVRDSTAIPA